MKKLVLCFDRAQRYPEPGATTNAHRLFHLLDENSRQLTWYHPGVSPAALRQKLRWRAADDARAAIAEAYQFLVTWWEPGDRIFVFGVGRGGYCAQTLTRLLSTVGVLPDLMDYVLAAYAFPRTDRTPQDWERVRRVAAELAGQRQIPVPVWFLGMWDAVKIPGFTRRSMPDPMPNVELGRHAVAIDGLPGERLVSSASDRIEEVWFRGTHCDVTGGHRACTPLAEITFDWMLDGATRAGLEVAEREHTLEERDALVETAHTISVRKLPAGAAVHSSVELYLREHLHYWKRMPADVRWSDAEWVDRGERPIWSQRDQAAVKNSVLLAKAG